MKILVIDESSTVDALDAAESRAVDLSLENVNLTMTARLKMLLVMIWPLFSDINPYDLVVFFQSEAALTYEAQMTIWTKDQIPAKLHITPTWHTPMVVPSPNFHH